MLAFVNGVGLCMGLIVSIGPQNLELIRAGLLKDKAYLLASVYIVCDACFIALGVLGVADVISLHPFTVKCFSALAVVILLYLAFHAFKRMNHPDLRMDKTLNDVALTRRSAAATVIKKGLLLSIFNPLVILETVIIIGSAASQYESDDKLRFAMGAILTSVAWFYAVSFSAQRFSHLLSQPKRLRLLEAVIGCILTGVAGWLGYCAFI